MEKAELIKKIEEMLAEDKSGVVTAQTILHMLKNNEL
jgi:hypothetical protein